jgi:hypothetical protein
MEIGYLLEQGAKWEDVVEFEKKLGIVLEELNLNEKEAILKYKNN